MGKRSAMIFAQASPPLPIWMQEFVRGLCLRRPRRGAAMTAAAYKQVIAEHRATGSTFFSLPPIDSALRSAMSRKTSGSAGR